MDKGLHFSWADAQSELAGCVLTLGSRFGVFTQLLPSSLEGRLCPCFLLREAGGFWEGKLGHGLRGSRKSSPRSIFGEEGCD